MKKGNTYVLWLPNWYPNRLEPFNGDFLKRHAEAVARHEKVRVVFVKRDKEGVLTRGTLREHTPHDTLDEVIVYYHSPRIPWGLADRMLSFIWFSMICFRESRKITRNEGKPRLVHLHIAGNMAIMAYIISRWLKVPLLYSEQSTYFLPEGRPQLREASFFTQKAYGFLLRSAAQVSVVSNHLGQCLRQWYPKLDYRVIPNVVDCELFQPVAGKPEDRLRNQFVHVSNMNYQKNIRDILAAFDWLHRQKVPFRLKLYGPVSTEVRDTIEQYGLTGCVSTEGEVPHVQLSKALGGADALILYSRYETFGCVIIEANASGLPVISSDYPVMRELIRESVNGYFVPGEDPLALAAKIKWFITEAVPKNPQQLHEMMKVSYEPYTVGKQFSEWYHQLR